MSATFEMQPRAERVCGLMFSEPKWEMFSLLALDIQLSLSVYSAVFPPD